MLDVGCVFFIFMFLSIFFGINLALLGVNYSLISLKCLIFNHVLTF